MYLTICCLNLFLHNNKKYFFDCIQKWSTKKYNEPNSPWTRSRKNSKSRSSLQTLSKIGVLKDFTNFIGERLCQSLFSLIKLPDDGLQLF